MKFRMLDFLICPYDGWGPLQLKDAKCFEEEIEGGLLLCKKCNREYPIIGGIPSIMPDALRNDTKESNRDTAFLSKSKEMKKRDELALTYEAHFTDYMNKIESKVVLDRLRLNPGDFVIDIGSGTGRLTMEYKDKCRGFLAVDFSLESLRALKERLGRANACNFNILHADITLLPVRENLFDKAISSQVFEHLPSEQERLQGLINVSRVLKPFGVFVLTAYNYNLYKRTNIFGPDTTGNKKEGFHSQGQIYYYNFTRSDFRRFLQRAFFIEDTAGFFNVPRQITWKFKKGIGKFLGRVVMYLDLAFSSTPFSYLTGLLLVAKCRKR